MMVHLSNMSPSLSSTIRSISAVVPKRKAGDIKKVSQILAFGASAGTHRTEVDGGNPVIIIVVVRPVVVVPPSGVDF